MCRERWPDIHRAHFQPVEAIASPDILFQHANARFIKSEGILRSDAYRLQMIQIVAYTLKIFTRHRLRRLTSIRIGVATVAGAWPANNRNETLNA